MTAIMNPTVNINGTSREELVQQRRDVADACRDLMEAIKAMTPNGRDYIGDPVRLGADREINRQRYAMVDALYESVMEEALHIHNGAK